jgi:integrase
MATIRKRGSKWQVQVRRVGHRPFSKSFNIRNDAVAWARQSEVQADRAELPTDPRALRRVTLGALIRRYRDSVSPRKKTGPTETIVLNAILKFPICGRTLSELCAEDFAAYRDERLKTIKPTTLKRELVPIRHMFEVAKHEWGLPIRENPVDKLKLKAPNHSRERRLRPGEFKRLMDAVQFSRNKLIEPIIRVALASGMRRGEILAIKKTDIDFRGRALLLTETKNGFSRRIPLTKNALEILKTRFDFSEARLFPITPNAFRLAWEHVRARAGLHDLHFHDLRHEAISRFFEIGLTTPEVSSISGHRDARMLFRYAHAERQTVIQKLDRQPTAST